MGQKIALTFDDGPYMKEGERQTLDLLDIIAQANHKLQKGNAKFSATTIKVTFFLQGRQLVSGHSIIPRLVNEGHEVGNHSWSHEPGVYKPAHNGEYGMHGLSDEQALEDVSKTHNLIVPHYPHLTLFRPPYGRIKLSQWNKIIKRYPSYRLIGWDRFPESDNPGFKDMKTKAKIVLLHDKMVNTQKEVTINNVKQFLDFTFVDIQKGALELVTVSEIISRGNYMDHIWMK